MPRETSSAYVPERSKRLVRKVLGVRYQRLFPDWHRNAVGGLWDEVGALQTRFLIEQGLRPEHRFLDVGCGSLRAGIHLIRYLEQERYHGIDASPHVLAGARAELQRHDLLGKAPRLRCDAEFDVDVFGQAFDYGIAHSLFTHLPINSILVCLQKVARVLRRPEGRFYATFFENPNGTKRLDVLAQASEDGPAIETRPDADPYHYGLDLFEWLCDGIGLRVEYIGEWGHPRSQKMLVFRPEGD